MLTVPLSYVYVFQKLTASVNAMFQEIPKGREQTEEFFKHYKENVLSRPKLKALENAKSLACSIQQGLFNLTMEVDEKNAQLKETESAIVDARKRRKILAQRLKEASLKNREALEEKLLQIDEVCNDLEKEKQQLVMHFEDKKLRSRGGHISDEIEALRIAKSLSSNYLQLSMMAADHDHRVVLKFPYRGGQQTLKILFDTNTRTVHEPQNEIVKFADELAKDGNVTIFLLNVWKYLRMKEGSN